MSSESVFGERCMDFLSDKSEVRGPALPISAESNNKVLYLSRRQSFQTRQVLQEYCLLAAFIVIPRERIQFEDVFRQCK